MMSDYIVSILKENGIKVSSAESLTAGYLQALLSSRSGASQYFVGGITAYNIDQKVNLLGVDRDHALSCDCVSGKVASAMALGANQLFGSDIGIATTGYSEIYPLMKIEHPQAYISVAFKSEVFCKHVKFSKDLTRQKVQVECARQAVRYLYFLIKKGFIDCSVE